MGIWQTHGPIHHEANAGHKPPGDDQKRGGLTKHLERAGDLWIVGRLLEPLCRNLAADCSREPVHQ